MGQKNIILIYGSIFLLTFFCFHNSEAFVNYQFPSIILGSSDPATINSFGENLTTSVRFDSSGNLWVAEAGNNRIVEYKAPLFTGESASVVLGQPNLSSSIANNGGISANSLNTPTGIAFDLSGNLWVVDKGNNRILEFTLSNLVTGGSASIVLGQADFTHNLPNQGGSPAANTLSLPTSLRFDSSGNLWVADSDNNRVLEFTTPFSSNEAASVVLGQADFTHNLANQGSSLPTANTLFDPEDVDFDPTGNIFVTDTTNNRVLEFTTPFSSNETASVVLGQADFTHNLANQGSGSPDTNTLNLPVALKVDSSSNLWVADFGNNRVLEFTTPFSNNETASVVLGQADFTHNLPNQGLPTSSAANTLHSPSDVIFDSSGNLWVAEQDNNRVLEFTTPFSSNESASVVLGQPNFYRNDANSPSVSASMVNFPKDLTFDSSGNLWVADHGNNRVLEFQKPFSTNEAASIVLGQPDFVTNSNNTGGLSARNFDGALGLTFDSSGNLWVADTNDNRILKFTTPFSNNEAASVVLGQADFTHFFPNQGAIANSQGLYFPTGLTFDSSGNLWVVDAGNNRVIKYPSSNLVTNGAATVAIGQLDLVSGTCNQGTSVAADNLCFPFGLTFDTSGNLWIGDSSNNRVLEFIPTQQQTGGTASVALGQPDTSSNLVNQGSTPADNTLNFPTFLKFDSSGNLWISDNENSRVLKFIPAQQVTNGHAANVIGQPDFVSNSANNGGVLTNTLAFPEGLTFDSSGNLWISDPSNYRILMHADLPTSTVITENFTTSGSNLFTAGTLATTFTALGSWNDAKIVYQQTDTNPQISNPFGVTIGKFFEIITNAPDIMSSRTVSLTYTTPQITGPPLLNETTLTINRYSGSWIALGSTVNTGTKTVTATTPGFSTFSLTGFKAPTITSAVGSDPSGRNQGFTNGDTITITFSDPTNEIGGTGVQTKSGVDFLFTFSQSLGSDYTGQWIDPKTFRITIVSASGNGNPQPGITTVSVNAAAKLRNAQNTSVSATSSVTLSGNFGKPPSPTITDFISDNPSNTGTIYANGNNFTIRFSSSTNQPGGTGILNKAAVGDTTGATGIFKFSQSLGTDYTGQWINARTFRITTVDATGGVPQIGTTTVQVNPNQIQDSTGTSDFSTFTSSPLTGSFDTFTFTTAVADGSSAATTLPSGIIAEIKLPAGQSGGVTMTETTAPTTTSNGTVSFLGQKVTDISPPTGSCTSGCNFSFTFTTDDLTAAGVTLSDVKILHDRNNDGDFDDSGEVLSTTIITTSDPNVFLATATDFFTSKFAIGGIVAVNFLLGAGGGGGSPASFSAQHFLNLDSLSPSAKDSILNEDPFTELKPSNDPTVPYYPFAINDKNYLVARYANTIETVTEKTGVPINLQFATPDKQVSHVEFYTNVQGMTKEIQDSDTYVIYDKNGPLNIVDPHGFFSDVKVNTKTDNNVEKITFTIVFAKPLAKSDILVRDWDDKKYSSETKLINAIEIHPSENPQTSSAITPDQTLSTNMLPSQPITQNTTQDDNLLFIKQWSGYDVTSISDSELLDHFGIKANHIPNWFMKTSKWIVNGDLDQQDFKKAIDYLYQKGMIK